MTLFTPEERRLAEAIARLDYCNPFLPERVAIEREALGSEYVGDERLLHARTAGDDVVEENVERLRVKIGALLERVRERVGAGAMPTDKERLLYQDAALFFLYHGFHVRLRQWIRRCRDGKGEPRVGFYPEFLEEYERALGLPPLSTPDLERPEHVFAFFCQLNRAFVFIYHYIVGGTEAAAQLRASVWQSIFTHDLRRYRRALYDRMGDISTLVTGPSGTGKELVARAIGMARYIAFDPRTRAFAEDFATSFHPLNLSAMSPTLIESELFGHRKGAFTGALEDRVGWFETCRPLGTVFLDEIGDLDRAIQVKLLRVLQSRSFQRLGESETRTFKGKVIAATNRDLAKAMADGSFRADFYYRLCADQIVTPSLRSLIGGDAAELRHLVRFIAERQAGAEAPALTDEVVQWIEGNLGLDYEWRGNFRELEQCVKNVMIRREYRPAPAGGASESFVARVADGSLTADDLLKGYCKLVYGRTGSFSETARRLGIDRRTVRVKVES